MLCGQTFPLRYGLSPALRVCRLPSNTNPGVELRLWNTLHQGTSHLPFCIIKSYHSFILYIITPLILQGSRYHAGAPRNIRLKSTISPSVEGNSNGQLALPKSNVQVQTILFHKLPRLLPPLHHVPVLPEPIHHRVDQPGKLRRGLGRDEPLLLPPGQLGEPVRQAWYPHHDVRHGEQRQQQPVPRVMVELAALGYADARLDPQALLRAELRLLRRLKPYGLVAV